MSPKLTSRQADRLRTLAIALGDAQRADNELFGAIAQRDFNRLRRDSKQVRATLKEAEAALYTFVESIIAKKP